MITLLLVSLAVIVLREFVKISPQPQLALQWSLHNFRTVGSFHQSLMRKILQPEPSHYRNFTQWTTSCWLLWMRTASLNATAQDIAPLTNDITEHYRMQQYPDNGGRLCRVVDSVLRFTWSSSLYTARKKYYYRSIILWCMGVVWGLQASYSLCQDVCNFRILTPSAYSHCTATIFLSLFVSWLPRSL